MIYTWFRSINLQNVHRSLKDQIFDKVNKKKNELALKQPKRKLTSGESNISKKVITQGDVTQMILEYICDGLIPFSTVENSSFKNIVLTGFPNCRVPCRETISSRLLQENESMKKSLIEEFANVSHVCITADGWTAHHR